MTPWASWAGLILGWGISTYFLRLAILLAIGSRP